MGKVIYNGFSGMYVQGLDGNYVPPPPPPVPGFWELEPTRGLWALENGLGLFQLENNGTFKKRYKLKVREKNNGLMNLLTWKLTKWIGKS